MAMLPQQYRTYISIHAPREGGDDGEYDNFITMGAFQSTPPARGATNP